MASRLESLDLNLIVALHALLEERHVTNAGTRLHIGQSAMSGILRRLRGYFGDELLVRVGNEMQLTPFAKSLVPSARAAYDAASALFAAGVEFDPQSSTRLFTVAASDYALARVAPQLLRRLDKEAARVRVAFQSVPANFPRDPDNALLQHDLLIIPVAFLPAYSSSSIPVFSDDCVVVMSASNPISRSTELRTEDLAEMPQLAASFGTRSHQRTLADIDTLHALASIEPKTTVDSLLALPGLIADSRFWSLMPRSLAQSHCRPPEFAVFEAPFPVSSFSEHAFWHPSRQRDAGLAWLREAVGSLSIA